MDEFRKAHNKKGFALVATASKLFGCEPGMVELPGILHASLDRIPRLIDRDRVASRSFRTLKEMPLYHKGKPL